MDLKAIRKDKGMTQAEVACAAGMSREAYTNIENGVRRPSVDAAIRIGAALGFKWALMFDDSEVASNAQPRDARGDKHEIEGSAEKEGVHTNGVGRNAGGHTTAGCEI